MAILHEYHAPQSIPDAVRLLTEGRGSRALLAGGVHLIGQLEARKRRDIDGLVDLGKLGLNQIGVSNSRLTIGATATLTDVAEHEVAGTLAGGILRRAARGEGPVNLRNMATVGGVIATAAYDSEFYAALLALDAVVTVHDAAGSSSTPLSTLGALHGLVTAITVPLTAARCGLARTARTPSDRPIVAAIALVDGASERVALCGVGDRPLLQDDPIHPPDNFKGSGEYRRALIPILIERALAEARG